MHVALSRPLVDRLCSLWNFLNSLGSIQLSHHAASSLSNPLPSQPRANQVFARIRLDYSRRWKVPTMVLLHGFAFSFCQFCWFCYFITMKVLWQSLICSDNQIYISNILSRYQPNIVLNNRFTCRYVCKFYLMRRLCCLRYF